MLTAWWGQFRDVIELVNERAKRVADVEALIELETLITYSEVSFRSCSYCNASSHEHSLTT